MQTHNSPISKTTPQVPRFAALLVGFFVAVASTAMLWSRLNGSDSQSLPAESPLAANVDGVPEDVRSVAVAADAAPFQLNEQQQRGKHIYLTGVSPTGAEMTALLGNSSTEVPAAMLTCVNCHRHDGRGKPEGGIFPSNIRWDELTKPYRANLPNGQSRPPYDESLLKRSIAMGLNPAGQPLNDAMPRYRMTHRDLADLVEYLKVIGSELDPGVTADKIRIGVILPPQSQFAEMHVAVRAATSAFVDEFNEQGGVYQREIELCFSEAPAHIKDRAEAAMDFVDEERLFALAGSFIAGAEADITRQLGEHGVPFVGPVTMYPQLDFPLNRFVFYLGAGLHGQGRALARFADQQQSVVHSRQAAILFPDEERAALVANTIQAECKSLGLEGQLHRVAAGAWHPDDWAESLGEAKPGLVFSLLSAPQNLLMLDAADACNWYPACFVPGAIVGPQLFRAPAGFDRRIFLSFPILPALQPGGMNAHHALGQRHDLPPDQLAAQFEALAAVQVLVHGLEEAGASPSRERLVEKLEGLYEYRCGFMSPITYGPNRRVGAIGAYVVAIDLNNKKLVTVSEWVDGVPAAGHPY